jgi:formylglycine-generating enzyme
MRTAAAILFLVPVLAVAQLQRGFSVEEKPAEILEKGAGIGERYAVLIGVSKYANPTISLNYAAADARSLYDILLDPSVGAYKPENVRLILDEQATRKNVMSAMNSWLKNRVKPEDSILIFYSGHGALGNASEAYWVTHDADVEDLASSALSNKEISGIIGSLPSKRKITLIDSCYSEATAKKYRALVPTNVFDEFKGAGVVTVTASNGTQKSVEVAGHGAFTYHLLDALQGKGDTNANGVVELDEMWSYLNDKVQKTAADAGNKQTPVLMAERLEHGFPLTINPLKAAGAVLASLKQLYAEGAITIDEVAEAERLFNQREGSAELRNLYKGLAEKALAPTYFRQLRSVLVSGAGAPAGGNAAMRNSPAPGGPAVAPPPMPGAPTVPSLGSTPGAVAAPGATGAELEAFRVAETLATLEGWIRFLQSFPQGYLGPAAQSKLEEMVRKRADSAAYNIAKQSDAEKAWEQYIQQFPSGLNLGEAQRRMSELRQKREAELAAFRLADSKNNEGQWDRFTKEFPSGTLAVIAEDRLETLRRLAREKEEGLYTVALKNNGLADWDRYLSEYPAGRFTPDAKTRRAEVQRKIDEEAARKAEADLYASAKGGDSIKSWTAYVAAYANGPHTAEAKARIEQLKWLEFADMVPVKGGAFTMGSESNGDEKPRHKVEVDGFLMSATEVTNAQYLKFVEETSHPRPVDAPSMKGYFTAHPQLPVVGVTYQGALDYCKWLSQKTGAAFRLPTEAEWEYAAAGGRDGSVYPWGAGSPKTVARYKDNKPPATKTVAKQTFAPTGFGLYNMAGNVAEWVMDWYGDKYYATSPAKNPPGPTIGKDRVVRGGSWNDGESDLKVSKRGHQPPATPSEEVGFRVVAK